MSPAMQALHEQLIQVKTESDNFRKQLATQSSKSDSAQHENKIRMRTLVDEIKVSFLSSIYIGFYKKRIKKIYRPC